MNILQNRIDNFDNSVVRWPYKDEKNYPAVKSFAEAGFYFPRRPKTPDTVRCFLCEVEVGSWRPKQSPFKRHETESPNCAWSRLNFPAASNRTAKTVAFVNDTPRSDNMRLARLSTFNHHNYWPPQTSTGKYPSGAKLAAAGFHFNPTSNEPARVQCAYCKLTLVPTNEDMLKKHQELSSGCPFFEPTHSTRRSSVKSNINKNNTPSIKRSSSSVSTSSETGTSELNTKRQKGNTKIGSSQNMKLVSSSGTAKSKSTTKLKKNDDPVWDFNKLLDSSDKVQRPKVTYGSHRPVHRLLSTRRTSGAVNILPDLKSSLIVKPVTGPLVDVASAKQASPSISNKNKKPEEAAGRKVVKKKGTASIKNKTHVLDTIINSSSKRDNSHVMEQAESSSPVKQVKTDHKAASSPIKKRRDKGKGRAFEHNYYLLNPVNDPISLLNTENKRLSLDDITNLSNESSLPAAVSQSPPVLSHVSPPLSPHASSPLLQDVSSPLLQDVSLPLLQDVSSPLLQHVSPPMLQHVSPPLLPKVLSPILLHTLSPILPQVSSPISAPVSPPVLKNSGDVFFHMDPQQIQSPKLLTLSERFLKKKPSRRLSLPVKISPVVMAAPPPPYEFEEDIPIQQNVLDESYLHNYNPPIYQPPVDIQTPTYIPRSPSPVNIPICSDTNSRTSLLTAPFVPVNNPNSPPTSREHSYSEIAQMQFLQSTPTTSGNRLASGFDIFGANPVSPIQVKIEPILDISFEEHVAGIQNQTVQDHVLTHVQNSVNTIEDRQDQSINEIVDAFNSTINNLKYEDF